MPIFKKTKFSSTEPKPNTERGEQPPKFDRPKILLIDLDKEVQRTLEAEGYNVASGTFGKPYKVQKGSHYLPVIATASLPNLSEQEIVVVDLAAPEPLEQAEGEKAKPEDELDWWAKCNIGVIDPRTRIMVAAQKHLQRIYENGGAFIIFSDSRDVQELVWARALGGYNGFSIQEELHWDNWSLLPIFSNLNVVADFGKELNPVQKDWALVQLLADHLGEATFCCTFEPQWHIEKQWLTLAKNKYGAAVAGCIGPADKSKNGWIFIFPRIKNKAALVAGLLKNILPGLTPTLFPHSEGQRWVHRQEYELPSVLEKAREISGIQDQAAQRIKELEKSIETERETNRFLYDLIRETGRPLVMSVIKALSILGFTAIVDVDKETGDSGQPRSLREDLRIHDTSPILVVDIKGIGGHPADADALQAQKHAFIYIQEQKRHDVRGLTIINHQRHIPALDRENEMPFRKEILDNAEQVSLGLITTWDLFRFARGVLKNGWLPVHVKGLFYQTGRILPIPTHYEFVGEIKQVWKPAFSVKIETGEARVGERLAIEFPVDFEEQKITSLRLNDADVQIAATGDEIGIARSENLPRPKPGQRVYRIKEG